MNRLLRSSLARSLHSRLRVSETGSRSISPRFIPSYSNLATLVPSLQRHTSLYTFRPLHSQAGSGEAGANPTLRPNTDIHHLPLQCPGCGAFSQTSSRDDAGFYDVKRKRVRKYIERDLESEVKPAIQEQEDQVIEQLVATLGEEELKNLGLDPSSLISDEPTQSGIVTSSEQPPLCDRCHNLLHYHEGKPISHPSVFSLAETIQESPHKHNHIYHLIDAADFPMSLVPRLHLLLGDVHLRSRNRRSRASIFHKNRRFDMSFIITRSDLLAPRKEQVDRMMPYLRDVLRQALGRVGKMVRLGNVRCVSAQRGWWTKPVKEEIWKRGGAGWMVGKVNVGKSQLFETIFPKGRSRAKLSRTPDVPLPVSLPAPDSEHSPSEETTGLHDSPEPTDKDDLLDVEGWLPPLRPELDYPAMPIVSSLPGTTASPIRIPFGGGRGELIDLPGLARSDLELYVQETHRRSLLMESRIVPVQQTIKPGQSLLLGGFIRITPKTPGLVILGYNFTPLHPHLTATDKAIRIQQQDGTVNIENIAVPGTGDKIQHAGSFQLRHDVTQAKAGPLTRSDAIDLDVERLPFRVLGLDILIEGVGWVELTAQIRASSMPKANIPSEDKVEEESISLPQAAPPADPWEALEEAAAARSTPRASAPLTPPTPSPPPLPSIEDQGWPVVDVYTPEGRFIGSRPPMNAWEVNRRIPTPVRKVRRSMKGAKKQAKKRSRELAQS